jgi:hypothetical protein
MVRFAETVHPSCVKISTISKWSETSIHLSLITYEPSGASKMIFEPMVHFAQTTHLSCTDTNNVSKHTEMRFHMTHVTKKFHLVRPNWFMSLWYFWRKSCTYLASRIAISANRLNRASTWASPPRSCIRCIQNDFWACRTFGANHAPILSQD